MALHWPTFFTRLGSAIVFSAIMMTGLLGSEALFLALITIIMVLCLRDYFRLMPKVLPGNNWPAWVAPATIALSVLFLMLSKISVFSAALHVYQVPRSFPVRVWPAIVIGPITLIVAAVLSKKTALEAALQAIGGIVYITLPIIFLFYMREISLLIPLALVLMIWTNDTMAYLVGSFIGKTPFSPISPKKTWEGTAGGAILTIAGAAIWGYYSPYYHTVDWMALALCAAVAGTAGDLFESKLKRMANVKDSGTMMPGHGGALDRFDSLLVATPFAFAYVYLFMSPIHLTIF